MMKRILSFLLAFLMVVSIFPAPTYATDSTDATITPTETPTDAATEAACPTCGTVDCTSDHTNWCADCKKDNCGQTHVFCETCKKNDCGVDHTAELLHIPMTSTGQKTTETQSPDYSEDVGKYVKLNEAIVEFTVYGLTPSTGTLDEQIFMHADFLTDTIFQIAEWMMKDGKVWYRLTFYKGGLDNNSTFAQNFPAEPWFMQTAANELVFVDTCTVCGKPDCSGHTWCDICEEYDCGKDHTQPPAEPENPCACCDSCTGTEGCTCECGDCDFYEKVEDPDVPSISATVNGQTVTVSGAALPEGAELVVTPVENEDDILSETEIEGGFLWDIKVYDAEGNEWQPDDGEVVNLEIEFASLEDGSLIDIMHFLESPGEITKAIESGNAEIGDVNGCSTSVLDAFEPAISAYSNATATYNNKLAAVNFENVEITNGIARISTTGFSIYSWNGSYSHTRYESGSGDRFVLKNSNGQTLFVTRGQTVYLDSGHNAGNSNHWSFSGPITVNGWSTNDRPYVTVNNDATLGASCSMRIDYDGVFGIGAFDHTVYFVVVEERTVNFNANGGSCSTTSATAITDGGSRVQNVTLPNATRTGYTFRGWYTAASGGTKIGDAGAAYMPASSGGTLYAQWDAIEYTVKFDPNTANAGNGTVTGSMPTLNMTYDVETTLPRNQFNNQGDGMVFLGWATSPTGDVVHKDGAKIKNLTTTNGATVTLYAKWKYGLASTVYIGINNTYHNPKGKYTAGGVTINSYHTYPNEPAQMTGDFDRVTDDNGPWRYDSASAVPLKNQAASYINGNIFNSPDYEMTYVEGENTLGIADPTGSAVRSMLKFTEADYNAMIAVWLEGMRNTLISYGDTSFDWQNAKASDFTIVPYVIKFQNYDSWYIDMVVVPKALYTLAYDGNIENGYTASFTGVAFPPSSQYTDGSTVNVIATPIGYNGNNMKVTKVVDGHTYTAVFQYWYDANGNTYGGSTGRNTIKLTADTILYAKWEYPDASFGNLNITKTVVDKDAYENPASGQNFTFKFTTSASGSYYYTIYDQSANVKNSGTIANNGTFTLQDGWRIRITDLPKNASYSVTENAVSYYTNVSGTVSGTINAGATTYATVTNEYQKNADYTVKHFLQNADKNGYTELGDSAEKLHGVIGTDTVAAAKNYNGYTPHAVVQKNIQADGKTVIEIYYDLIAEAAIKWNAGEGQFIDGTKEKQTSHEYGAIPTPPEQPSKESTAEFTYTFDKWTPTIVEVTGDTTYTATYSQTKNKYTVTGTIDHGGKVTNTPQSVEYGEANLAMVFTPAQGYEISGVSVNGEPVATFDPSSYSFCQTITKDTTVEVTTSCVVYTITYDMQGGVLDTQKTNPKNYTVETETFTLNNPTKPGYKFLGWATSENATSGTETVTIEKGTTGNKTFYAVWERSLVDLTIKTRNSIDTEQSYIFTVTGQTVDHREVKLTVVLGANDKQTIVNLPAGVYTIQDQQGWSWRYDSQSKDAPVYTNVVVDFNYTYEKMIDTKIYWLNGYGNEKIKQDTKKRKD